MTNCTTKLEVHINGQGFALQTTNKIAKRNSSNLNNVLKMQEQLLMHERANYSINLENCKIKYANQNKIDFIVNNIKKSSSDSDLESMFKQVIAIPIPDKDNLPKKIEDLKRQVEKVHLNQSKKRL